MSIIPISFIQTENGLISYFKQKEALSENTAIDIDEEAIRKTFQSFMMVPLNIKSRTYIIKTERGKYYLDEKLYKVVSKKQIRGFIIALVCFAFFCLAIAIFLSI